MVPLDRLCRNHKLDMVDVFINTDINPKQMELTLVFFL